MDNHALRWVLNLADETSKLASGTLRVIEFDFYIVHTAEINQQAADALSRLLTNSLDSTMLENEIRAIVVTISKKKALNFLGVDATDGYLAYINSAPEK